MRRLFTVACLLLLFSLAALGQANVAMSQPKATTGSITTSSTSISAPVGGLASASVSIHGTHAGINFSFFLSDDSTDGLNGTWYTTTCSRTDLTLWQAITGVLASNASLMWDCGAYGATYLKITSTAWTSGAGLITISPTAANIEPALTVGVDTSSDPCASPSAVKQSASVAFSSSTTAALVAASAGKKIYVCSIYFTMSSGTTPTIAFKGGTGGSCGSNIVTFTGTMALPTASGSVIQFGGAYSSFVTAAGSEFCATTAGTTPTGNGFITYVQQ
jgi:hypothetical protein